MRVEPLTPVLRAAPGERARCRLRIENTDAGPMSYGLRIVGFDESNVLRAPGNGPLAGGSVEEVELEFLIPDAFAAGHHSVAVEVMPDRPGSAPVIAGITVAVGQIDDVAMAVVPSTVRGHRRGKFRLDLDNRSRELVDLELGGEGPDLAFTLRPDRVALRPGDRVRTGGKVKGPRHYVGEPRQLSFTITARSKSAPSYAPATFHQRPVFPRGLRTLLGVLVVFAIWAGALGAGVYWWTQRDEQAVTASYVPLVDTDGDGKPDTLANEYVDTDGDGEPDTLASVVAAELAPSAGEQPQPGGAGVPTRTVIGGTVKAGETGDDENIGVTLSPIDLASAEEEPAATGPAGQSRPLHRRPVDPVGFDQPGVSSTRRTVSVKSRVSGPDGAWQFADVPIRQTYEVNFFREGFDSQSFVVTPPADGTAVQMDVVLEPASGALSGTVFGPGGPLGNVDLVLTDGELTFNTTTASDGDVGTWSLSGVSTPGTYTLTATLRGYGTEVLQITLDPGEQRTGMDVSMVPDVGSIVGSVSASGERLGGVTLTASSGDVTTTTTSLTEGDTGFYTFPRLTTPGRYTVTAAADGYVTQTRLVTLGGNVTGVNFNLDSTTATIKGVVISTGKRGEDDIPAGPLPNAQITVSRDDLSFDTDSASRRSERGSFEITDLPPGTYLVGFSRFDHRPASEIVTVAAGEEKDLGRIPLRFRPRSDIEQNGSLVVEVVDNGGDPLTGATVEVRDVGTGERVASDTEENGHTFTFPLDVGTYRVAATKPQFKPRTTRVSIGPNERERVTLILFEQGQASGQIVDSLTDAPLTGYLVTIHTVLSNGDVGPPFLPPISPNPPDDDGKIFWETPPRSLPIGRYAVVVTQPPSGYRVRPDQTLMAGLPPMQFAIRPEGEDALVLNDIEADPLPNVTGRVVAPDNSAINSDSLQIGLTCPTGSARFEGRQDADGRPGFDSFSFPNETVSQALGPADSAVCTITFELVGYVDTARQVRLQPSDGRRDPDIRLDVVLFPVPSVSGRVLAPRLGAPNAVSFVAINTDPLVVGLTCPGHDEIEGQQDGDGLPGFDSYEFPRETIEELLGAAASVSCTLRFDAAGYVAITQPVQLLGSDTTRNPDVVLNVALLKPSQVGGTAYWTDRGNGDARMPAGGISVRSTGRVITGFNPSTGAADPTFIVSPAPVSAVTTTPAPGDAGGMWVFGDPRQRFGRMTYDFTDPAGNYQDRQIAITIDENGRTAAPVTPPTGLDLDNSIAVELDANGGAIDGHIAIRSTTPDFTGFEMVVTGAADSTTPVVPVAPSSANGLAHVTTDDPGTYEGAVTIPAHHRSFDGLPQSGIPLFQNPGQDREFTRTYVELGQLNLRVQDALGNAIPTATVDVRHDNTGAPGDPPTEIVADDVDLDANGARSFFDLAVNGDDPEGTPVTYTVTATVAGHDLTDGTATVAVVAGGSPDVVITLPGFGSITGTVVGRVPGQPDTALRVGSRVQIVAVRVDGNGDPVGDPPLAVRVDPGNDDGFAVSGPPGFYTIDVSHPDFEPFDPPVIPPGDAVLGGRQVYRMSNVDPRDDPPGQPDAPNAVGEWALRAKSGNLDLTVHEDTLTGPLVADATITLAGPNDPNQNVDLTTGNLVEDPPGHFRVTGLVQGDYVLTIRELDADNHDLSFPVIVTVNIPFGPSDNARTRVVDAPLPQIGGELAGEIVAENSEQDPVPVPEVTVTRDYTPPQVQVGPGPSVPGTTDLVDSSATEDDLDRAAGAGPVPSVTVGPDANGDPVRYEFENLATGAHQLHFPAVTGYSRAPTELTGVVDSLTPVPPGETNVDPVTYDAQDRTVVINVTSGGVAVNDATVTVTQTDPDDDDEDRLTAGTDGAYTFVVPPELTDYEVTVERDLHETQTDTFHVAPGDPETVAAEVDIDLPTSFARISGTARRRPSASTTVPVTDANSVRLLDASSGEEVASATPDSQGRYFFEIATADLVAEYRVRVEVSGYATRESTDFAAPAGQETTVPDVVVPALATVNITVAGPAPPVADLDVTVIAPASQTGVTPTRTGRTFAFRLDPGTNPGSGFTYRFRVAAPGFIPQDVPNPGVTPTPGQTVNVPTVTLVERTLGGRVTPAADNTRVDLRNEAGDTVDTTMTDDDGDYTFTGVDAGTWTIVSARFRAGRVVVTRTIAATDGSVTLPAANLEPRDVNVSFTVTPSNANVVLRSGNTTIDSTPPLVGTEDQLPFTLRASRTGFVMEDFDVPLPPAAGSFNALSFNVGPVVITLEPVPPPPPPAPPAPAAPEAPTTTTPSTTTPASTSVP